MSTFAYWVWFDKATNGPSIKTVQVYNKSCYNLNMENFNPNEYRNDLASRLKESRSKGETGKLEAKNMLSEAQSTDEYQILKDVKKYKNKIIKKTGEIKSFEKENQELDLAMEKFGFDVIDISNKIPKEINLLIEQYKISGDKLTETDGLVEKFIDKITDNKYLCGKYLNHTSRYNPHYNDKERENNQENENFFDKKKSFLTQINVDGQFYFSAGKNGFININRPLMIFSKENPNFTAFLLSELLDHHTHLEPKTRSFIEEEYIYKNSASLEQVIEALKNDKIINKIISEKTKIIYNDKGEKTYHISDLGYHSQYAPSIVSFLVLTDQEAAFSNYNSGVMINGGHEISSMIDSGLFKMKGEPFSFATLSDTIVDLPSHRMYKFNKEKFLKN